MESVEFENFDSLKKYLNKENIIISENILNKVELIKNLINNDVYVKKSDKILENIQYISGFNCKFKNEDIKKKKITSFLNKLTIENFNKILNNIKNDMDENYYNDNINIIIKFMINQKENFDMYKKILNLYPIDNINNIIDKIYIENKNYWLIPEIYLNVYLNNCDYDLYCDFIKWRNKSILISKLLLSYKDNIICKNILNEIINYIYKNKIKKREILDVCIDNINIFNEYIEKKEIENLLKIDGIEKSSKFKLLEIYEKK
jgi:hypothetical protein